MTAVTGDRRVPMVDFGGSNMRSVQKAFEAVGVAIEVTSDPEVARRAVRLVLPFSLQSPVSLQAAQKNYDAQQDRYKQGLAIPLDLLNAQVDVATAQSNAIQARYDYYTSYAQLEYAIGKQGGLYAR